MNHSHEPHDSRTAILLFAFLVSLYTATASGHLYSMDDQTQYFVLESLWERGELAIALPDSERHLNTTTGIDGRLHSYYGFGSLLIFAPFFIVGRLIGALVGHAHYIAQAAVSMTNVVFTAGTASLLFLLARGDGAGRRAAKRGALIYALATVAFVWARMQYTSVMVGTLLLAALYFINSGSARRALIGGALGGLAFATRYDSLPAFILISLIPLASRRSTAIISAFAGFTPFATIAAWHNLIRFGSPFATGYPEIAQGSAFSTPLITGLSGLLVLPTRGLFWYAPAFLLLFFLHRSDFTDKNAKPRRIIAHLVLPIFYLFFYSKYIVWHGAAAWGPRLLGAVLPLTAYWFAYIDIDTTALRRTLGRGVIVTSLAIQIWGTTASVDSYHDLLTDKGINQIESAVSVEYSALWGIAEVVRDFRWNRLADFKGDRALPAGGYDATLELRATPDYWPFYAWKVGMPLEAIVALWLIPAGCAIWYGKKLFN